MKKLTVCLTALSGLIVVGVVAPRKADARSSYKRIKKGVGNCIFSSKPLPHRKESTYSDVRKVFYANDANVI